MAPVDEEKLKNAEVTTQNRPKKRVNKPLIEKRRRERINECLNQLQSLISQLDKEKCKVGRPAKLEKADILEMTVEFVRKTKTGLSGQQKDASDVHQQSYVAGYRKCMDEITNFCKDNNIPADLKNSLQSQVDFKIRQLKTEQAIDLTNKCEMKDYKDTEQLHVLANNSPAIQPKFVRQSGNSNHSPVAEVQNTNFQIIQRPSSNAPGQVTVVCQKEPSTFVLLPTTAFCQPIQISSASQGYPIIVQNSAPNYDFRSNLAEKCGPLLPVSSALGNNGQILMLSNSSSTVNTGLSPNLPLSSICKVPLSHSCIVVSSTNLPSVPSCLTSSSSTVVSTQSVPLTPISSASSIKPIISSSANRQCQFQSSNERSITMQEEVLREDNVWRPW